MRGKREYKETYSSPAYGAVRMTGVKRHDYDCDVALHLSARPHFRMKESSPATLWLLIAFFHEKRTAKICNNIMNKSLREGRKLLDENEQIVGNFACPAAQLIGMPTASTGVRFHKWKTKKNKISRKQSYPCSWYPGCYPSSIRSEL